MKQKITASEKLEKLQVLNYNKIQHDIFLNLDYIESIDVCSLDYIELENGNILTDPETLRNISKGLSYPDYKFDYPTELKNILNHIFELYIRIYSGVNENPIIFYLNDNTDVIILTFKKEYERNLKIDGML